MYLYIYIYFFLKEPVHEFKKGPPLSIQMPPIPIPIDCPNPRGSHCSHPQRNSTHGNSVESTIRFSLWTPSKGFVQHPATCPKTGTLRINLCLCIRSYLRVPLLWVHVRDPFQAAHSQDLLDMWWEHLTIGMSTSSSVVAGQATAET